MRTDDGNTFRPARSAIDRARALMLAAVLGPLANGAAQESEAVARLSAVNEQLAKVRTDSPHRLSDEELAAATAAVAAVAAPERSAPTFVASLARLADTVTALERPDAALSWLQPVDEDLLAGKDTLRQHELAVPLATALLRLGRARQARERLEPAYAAVGQPKAAADPRAQGVRRLLAVAMYAERNYAAALPLQQLVVAIARENAADVPRLVEDLRQLGRTHHRLGQRQAAYDAFEECLTLARKTWPADHEQVLHSLSDQAAVAAHLGDYRAAYELMREAITGYERTLPATHRDLLEMKQGLSQILVQLGAADEARALQAAVLAALEASSQRDDPLYCTGLQYYARILYGAREYDGSYEAIRKAIAMLVGKVPEHDRDLNTARDLLGCLERRRGNLPESRKLLETAFAGLTKSLPPDHSFTQIACGDLICACQVQGDNARAVELASGLLDAALASVQKAALSARASARLVSIQNIGIKHALSLAFDDFDAASRQRLLQKILLVSQLLKGYSGHVARHANRLGSATADERARLAAELAAPQPTDSPTALVERVRDMERLEREAARERTPAAGTAPTIESLARALPKGAAAVAIVPFARVRLDPGSAEGLSAEEWLAGLVLSTSGEVRLVDLGSRNAMLDQVDGMKPSTHKQMRSLVIDPLRAAAPDATVLVLALDDCLHLVPWDALPLPSGAPVGSAVELRRVSTLLDLVADAVALPKGPTKLVAVGGVDYAARKNDTAPAPVAGIAPPMALLRDGGSEFAPLQGSRLEVAECETSFRAAFPGSTVTLLTANGATKGALAAALPGAAFVHFATHGFVAYERIQAKTAVGANRLPDVRLALAPFSLCGLALSGANLGVAEDGRSPGLLTAEELQHYDLSRCHLAVLSACESALGAWSQGQGFASLHEALHIAGARYVVSSLWPVGDDAARRFMAAFYQALWRAPDQPYRALWSAKQACIAEGMTFRDWAAFQLSGT